MGVSCHVHFRKCASLNPRPPCNLDEHYILNEHILRPHYWGFTQITKQARDRNMKYFV